MNWFEKYVIGFLLDLRDSLYVSKVFKRTLRQSESQLREQGLIVKISPIGVLYCHIEVLSPSDAGKDFSEEIRSRVLPVDAELIKNGVLDGLIDFEVKEQSSDANVTLLLCKWLFVWPRTNIYSAIAPILMIILGLMFYNNFDEIYEWGGKISDEIIKLIKQ